ncbi:MAG: pyruvate ferredoxin oxidoreductase [Leptolinea sp.]|jgi:indolepyruvate ferredoxin oxidoreductase alpha subunit|nr:pyruvate ferredoxin oxidoreductase [Leptolinea sp.]
MSESIRALCESPAGKTEILLGNIAFAVGCVRGGVHAADGYPGTPSSEVIDRGLSEVQDLIHVDWSVNEAVASAVGVGHSLAGRDCVVTMKIPGLFQAGDIFTSGSAFAQERGGLVYYIASDFTPSSTQHVIDPRYLFKSCFIPVLEPRNHQELHESAAIAVEIARKYKTQVVIFPNGNLCHSEGLVHLMEPVHRDPVQMPESLKEFSVFPGVARKNYDLFMRERMPALVEMVETSPLNRWEKGSGKLGVVTAGMSDCYVREVKDALGLDIDILSLAFTNPLPMDLITEFYNSIHGDVYVIEDGYRFIQEAMLQAGLHPKGKEEYDSLTEWSPALIAEKLGKPLVGNKPDVPPVVRPPSFCAGCPYRLFAQEVALLRKKKQVDVVFGDIGCNGLLYFMNALDTALAMGASEGQRIGYVMDRPEQVSRCLTVVGDSTECHTGMDATRNAIYRNVPGVKVILDNSWTGMTGAQPTPTSPVNLSGQPMKFNLPASLRAHGANVIEVGAYDKKGLRSALKTALDLAAGGTYTTVVVQDGVCIQKANRSTQRVMVDPEVCKKCGACLICPGLEAGPDGVPVITNLCTGCGGNTPACVQTCPTGVLHTVDLKDLNLKSMPDFPVPEAGFKPEDLQNIKLPERLSVAIRGVGGQGNLFFGAVLTQLAFLAGYDKKNIIKGETHGMAQMGGPVISTFACGKASSPVFLPGTTDCLIVMEKSEVLRPDFLALLKPGGTVLLADTCILPLGFPKDRYPTDEQIISNLKGYRTLLVNVLGKALELGDQSGRIANVVMMGVLSTLTPFDRFPEAVWRQALRQVNAKSSIWAANVAAFRAGRELASAARVLS